MELSVRERTIRGLPFPREMLFEAPFWRKPECRGGSPCPP